MSTFGELLKEDREALRWSQEQLGEALGVSQQTIAQWESGNAHPRRERRQKLYEVLNRELHGRSKTASTYAIQPSPTPVELALRSEPPAGFAFTRTTPQFETAHLRDQVPPPSRFQQQRRERHEALRNALPEHLRMNVAGTIKYGQHERVYDYVSRGVTARITTLPDGALPAIGSLAHMLLPLAMAANQRDRYPFPEPTVGLFIISKELPAILVRRLGSVAKDARVLGVEILPVPTIEAVAQTITQFEEQYAKDLQASNEWLEQQAQMASEQEWEPDFDLPDTPPADPSKE